MGSGADVHLASTIGSNPWNERTRKQRRVVGSLTTAPAIKRLAGMLDLETSRMVEGLFEASKGGKAVSPHIYQKRLALNIVLMFCYGRRFEDIADPLLHRILGDAKIISRCVGPLKTTSGLSANILYSQFSIHEFQCTRLHSVSQILLLPRRDPLIHRESGSRSQRRVACHTARGSQREHCSRRKQELCRFRLAYRYTGEFNKMWVFHCELRISDADGSCSR